MDDPNNNNGQLRICSEEDDNEAQQQQQGALVPLSDDGERQGARGNNDDAAWEQLFGAQAIAKRCKSHQQERALLLLAPQEANNGLLAVSPAVADGFPNSAMTEPLLLLPSSTNHRVGLLSCDNGESPRALLPELATNDGEEEEEEEEETGLSSRPETLPTMNRTMEPSRYHHSYRQCWPVSTWVGRMGLVGALWIVSVIIVANSVRGNENNGTCHDASSITGRWIAVTRCIQELSHLDASEMTPQSHSYRLALWFMGPGYNVAVDDSQKCAWGTPFADLYALLLFRDSVKVRNPSWYQERDGDIAVSSEMDVCEWKRVKCENGKVTGLIFNNAGLYGSLPSEIGGLLHLKEFHVYDNSGLTGTMPTEIGKMSSLISLQLHKTDVEGTIPTELGRLMQLEELLLEETLLTGTMPSQVCTLPHLSALRASCQGETTSVQCSCCTSCH